MGCVARERVVFSGVWGIVHLGVSVGVLKLLSLGYVVGVKVGSFVGVG